MEFLLWLQEIRTPFVNDAALFISMFCDKILLIAIFCYVFWCKDKRFGYGLGFSFVLSGILVQGIKIAARVQRPFVRNPAIRPSKKALETATGYSFPSGHTQTAASLLGYTAFNIKQIIGKGLCFFGILLVMLSRMILGVHTVLDVTVSFVITVLISWLVTYYEDCIYRYHGKICGTGIGLSIILLLVTVFMVESGRVPYLQADDCIVMCVCGLTFFVCWFIENKFIKFDPSFVFGKRKAVSQIIKFVVGMAVVIVIYAAFSAVKSEFLEYLSYVLIFFWICCCYPLIIKRYGRGK